MNHWTITTIPPACWRLSPAETDVMDAVVELGQVPKVAEQLGCTVNTIQTHVQCARKKMGAANVVVAAVAWDRYSRERA